MFTNERIKVFLAAFVFLTFEILFEAYKLNLNYSKYLVESYYAKSFYFFLADFSFVAVSFFLFFLFILFAINASRTYKIICFLIFSISVGIEFGYQKALGRFSHISDIDAAVITTWEQKLFSSLMYLNSQVILPCAVFFTLLFLFKSGKNKNIHRNFVLTALLFVLFFSLIAQYGKVLFESDVPSPAMNAFYQTGADYVVNKKISLEPNKWELEVNIKRLPVENPVLAENYQPDNNIIFIVDESVTGSHFSLNGYARQTTPFLDNLQSRKILHNWGIAAASATDSIKSYRAIITGLTPDEISDKNTRSIGNAQTFFQYAKAMRYKTHYFDGQLNEYWGGSSDDKNYIDSFVGYQQLEDNSKTESWETDNQIAKQVNKIIESSTGNFIFIFKHGSHIPYQKNFPPSETVWSPSYNTIDVFGIPSEDRLPEVVNAYDNSIRYNVNSFFKNLVDDYDAIPNRTVILYTADHGQTLFKDGRASHAGTTKIEATVPFFIIGNLEKQPDTNYLVSHYNIFPTLLDLMGYPENLKLKTGALSVLDAKASDSKPRFYNPGLGKKYPFD